MPSVKSNIVIEQGATFVEIINLNDANGNPIDVASLNSATAEMRKYYSSSNSVVFTTSLATGTLTLSLTANQTSNIYSGRYVFDVYLTDIANNVTRIVEGLVTVTPSVTH
jgi:hypothetical protein